MKSFTNYEHPSRYEIFCDRFCMDQLPLVEYVSSLHGDISLSRTLLIGTQHLLETTHTMLRVLYRQGLNPKNIFLLGKCYSTSRSVMEEMEADNIYVSKSSLYFNPDMPFDHQFRLISIQFLKDVMSRVDISSFERVIIIDDGGELIKLCQEMLKGYKNIVGVEQTTSGYEKLKNADLFFPVINVARSPAKLIYESPMIAETVVKKIQKRIANLENTPQKILIIGNGAIGSALSTKLKEQYSVDIYDHKENSHRINQNNLDAHLNQFDLIIGCTGQTCIPVSKYRYLKKGCVLISASSSDREFDAVQIRKAAREIQSCHDDIEANGIRLLNCGFPINFDGDRHSVPPSKIQLTRALLTTGIFQAYSVMTNYPDIIPLDIDIQRDVIHKFLEYASVPAFAMK